MSLLVLATDVKPHLKITETVDDTVLQAKLDAAESYVSNYLGGSGALAQSAVTQRTTGYGAPSLVLNTLPVVSVTSVTGSDGVALSVGSLDVDTYHGIIRWSAFYPVPFLLPYYTIVYQSGYASAAAMPQDLVEAVRLITQHFYDTQRGSNRRSTGGDIPGQGDAFSRANQILDGYTVPGFA